MNKREIRQAAARLRGLGRVVPVGRTDDERLSEARQALRTADTYEDAAACADCQGAQQQTGDPTALCPIHLARAMGA